MVADFRSTVSNHNARVYFVGFTIAERNDEEMNSLVLAHTY